ncbi:MAG TPA: CDP-diacylglycerol--glycerol-3-phosphate 3-phosphatidyltransferase [Terriglobales bacterium]|nr:CDP-diacylglycerol--glycerol-3-phosphate 3-phosphatidyltransferase [Terriglobales bacterium]
MNLPNSLTLLRIFLVPLLIAVLFSTRLANKEIYGTAIFLAAAITDLLDGYIARRRRQVTTLGILLDPIADKLLMAAAFISLVQLDPALVPAWMVVIILGREFAVTGLRSIAASQGFTIAANEWGKAKMVSQVVAVCIIIVAHKYGRLAPLGIEVNVRWLGKAALWIVVVVALVSASSYFLRFWRQIDDSVKRRQRGLGEAEGSVEAAILPEPRTPAPAPSPTGTQPPAPIRR